MTELHEQHYTLGALEVRNVKGVRAVNLVFDPDRNLFVVGGENEAGKTSTIDALWYAIGGARNIPNKPIREGEREAYVELKVRNRDTKQVELIARRKWYYDKKGNLKTSLELTDAIGTPHKGAQGILDRLYSHLIDPIEFLNYDHKKQVDAVRACVGLDFAEMDKARAAAYQKRTNANSEVDTLKAQYNNAREYPEAIGKEVPDLSAIFDEQKKRDEAVRKRDNLTNDAEAAIRSAKDKRATIEAIDAQVAELRRQIKAKLEQVASITREEADLIDRSKRLKAEAEAVVIPEDVDASAKIKEAEELKSKIAANASRAAKLKELEAAEAKARELDEAIAKIDREKETLLANATFPVEGMGFTGDFVTYKGRPLDQCSTSEQIRVSMGMACADLPPLPVLFIRRSESLDVKRLKAVEELAKEVGAYVIAERVSTGPECSVVIEDGVGSTPTPEPKTASGRLRPRNRRRRRVDSDPGTEVDRRTEGGQAGED